MRIAYIILAHHYPQQLIRLVSNLNTDNASFFIHIDKKTHKIIYNQIFSQFYALSNVFFVKRHNSKWGTFNILRATLEAINSIIETRFYFDYVILLSGQDYSIKSNTHIKMFLEENQGKEFIEYWSLPYSRWGEFGGFNRIEYWHLSWKNQYFSIPQKKEFESYIASLLYSLFILPFPKKRKLPEGFPIYGGSQFWCLTGECVKWINIFVKQNPKFVKRFDYTFCPDEMFFQTILLNSPFKDKIVSDNLKYIDWGNFNGYHPIILDKNDFEKIRDSKKLFARKFDVSKDFDILDMIDKMILSK